MSLPVSPPPMQTPSQFTSDKQTAAFFNSLINTIYQLWEAEYGRGTSVRVTTEDATQTAMLRVSISEGTTTMIDAKIVARRTAGDGSEGDSAFYHLQGAYKNVGGVLTGIGTPIIESGEDVASWTVGFSSSSNYAIVIVQGAANTDVTWEGEISAYTVGS